MCRCLYCYRELSPSEHDFHPRCARSFFGNAKAPVMDYTLEEIDCLAAQVISDCTSLTGVQPKLSLHLNRHEGGRRLTIVGLWGDYICKPQSPQFRQLPELEHLTMKLAECASIAVVPHTLMRMADGTLCYLTRRIDREGDGHKIAMEDMCQITGRLTEHKYKSSYERIAKAIAQFSSVPLLDVANFFDVVLFAWITGNNDMHLKNFSLYQPNGTSALLTPAYDLINASIVNPSDDEELALTLNGRKKSLRKSDFFAAAATMGVNVKTVEKLIAKHVSRLPGYVQIVKSSFLDEELQQAYIALLRERIRRLC